MIMYLENLGGNYVFENEVAHEDYFSFALVTVISTAGLIVINFVFTQSILKDEVYQKLTQIIELYNQQIDHLAMNSIYSGLRQEVEQLQNMSSIFQSGRTSLREFIINSKIGKEGYLFSVKADGSVVDHPYLPTGTILTQLDFIKNIKNTKKGFFEYKWKNVGESDEREKYVYLAYFSGLDIYVCATAYKSDFDSMVDKEMIYKQMIDLHIGKSGYAVILDQNNKIIMHPRTDLIGKNASDMTDERGYNFGKVVADNNSGKIVYVWKGVGESIAYEKYGVFKTLDLYNIKILLTVSAQDMFEQTEGMRIVIIIGAIVILTIMMIIGFWVSGSILKIVDVIDKRIKGIASGTEKADLSQKIEHVSGDELGEVIKGINMLIEKLNDDMVQVKYSTENLAGSSQNLNSILESSVKKNLNEIKTSIDKIDGFTEEQTSGVEEVNATLEEISRNVDSISESITRQAAAVEESASAIEEMTRNIENTTAIANKTQEITNKLNSVANEGGKAVQSSVSAIREVSEYSQQILKMLKLITDISKQTNLLAMNASIEAAHAGEAGKGFAIVADEIRRLAESTNKNAKDIGEVVNSIVQKIGESVSLAEKAGIGLEMIVAYSNQSVSIISQLNTTMEEQNHSAKEILRSTQEIVQITEEVKLSMQEQKTGTDEFAVTMRNLRDLSLDAKGSIKEHISNLGGLMSSFEQIRHISEENNEMSQKLQLLLENFKLNESGHSKDSSTTALKLVE